MRIYIIGLAGSGKSTFAIKLATLFHIPCVELDTVYFQRHATQKRRDAVMVEEIKQTIKHIVAESDWIVEGVYINEVLLQHADQILWIQPYLFTILFRQWKRYCRDKKQRQEHGFVNNLKLSYRTIRQYTSRGLVVSGNKRTYLSSACMREALNPYQSKVMLIKGNADAEKAMYTLH